MPKRSPAPFALLIDHLGKPAYLVAQDCGISVRSAYTLKDGGNCGRRLWLAISERYPLELRQLGLTAEDFLAGQVLAGPVGRRA